MQIVKRLLYRVLSLEGYLKFLQSSFFFMYRVGLLKGKREYAYHYYVKNLIHRGDVVIDIGANLGYYSLLFSKWVGEGAGGGQVYSVEPIEIYNRVFMSKARRRSNITLLPYALGETEGRVTLVTTLEKGYLQTGLPHVYDPKSDGELSGQEFRFEAEMRVPAKLFSELNKIDYIKCDIEGYEQIVLSNMKPLLEKHRPIVQVEIWSESESELFKMFREMNYRCSQLNIEGDGLVEISCETKSDLTGDYLFIPNERQNLIASEKRSW